MQQKHANSVTLFASLVVLVTIAIHSASGLPIDASKRQEIVLSIGDALDGGKPSAGSDFDATPSHAPVVSSPPPVPQIGKLLITPAAISVASDPMASWSGPLIGSGKFHPMPLVPQAAKEQSEADKGDAAPAANKPTPADDTSKPPAEPKIDAAAAAKNATAAVTPPDADKLKDITDALAKAEDKAKAPDAAKPADDAANKPTAPLSDTPKPVDAAAVKPTNGTATPDAAAAKPPADATTRKRRSMVMQKRSPLRQRSKYRRDLPPSQDGGAAACTPAQDVQTFVPVTYTELRLIKQGQYKVQQTNASGNASESACAEGKVLLVPVSEEAMMALQQGLLQLVSAGTQDTVILETVEEATAAAAQQQQATSANGTTDGANSGNDTVSTPGPSYSVVPVDEDDTSDSNAKQLRIKLQGGAADNSSTKRKRQNISRRQFSIANVEHAGPAVIKRALVDRFPVLEKRTKPSSADNTTLFGNGKGKLKYGHKIHYNAGVSDVMPRSTSIVTVFAALSIFALAGNLQL